MSNSTVALSSEEILARVQVIVADELELDGDPKDLDPTAHFVEDFDADSLALIQILARIDKELGISVPVGDAEKLTDLATLAGHVSALAEGAPRA